MRSRQAIHFRENLNNSGKTEQKLKEDLSQIWNVINKLKCETRIRGILHFHNREFTDPEECANAFAEFFSVVYIKNGPSESTKLNDQSEYSRDVKEKEEVNEAKVLQVLNNLANKLTVGTDQLPSFFIAEISSALVENFRFILNLSLNTAELPKIWKIDKVCPVFKYGLKSDVTN